MASMTMKKQDGAQAGSVELSGAVFEADQNAVLVREVYNAYMSNQRQGTHSTKTRGEVRGGGRKPWKQKGTGRARQGSIRAPQWRGGAIIFGPSPRSYNEKINRKKRQGAFRAVLSSKLERGEIIVIDSFAFTDGAKTKDVLKLRADLNIEGRALIVTNETNGALVRAARNLEADTKNPTRVAHVGAFSIFDLLTANVLVLTQDALRTLEERLS